MHSDAERWDRKYRDARPRLNADALLVDYVSVLAQPPARVLDVACGTGHNVLWFAACGYTAFGVDASLAGLKAARREAIRRQQTVHLFVADLDVYRPPPAMFDVIAVFRYLNRPLLPALATSLRPGGVLIYQTFNQLHSERTGFNPNYVLQPGELRAAFSELTAVVTNDQTPAIEPETFLIARRP